MSQQRTVVQQTGDACIIQALMAHPDVQKMNLPAGFNWAPFIPLILAAFEELLKQFAGKP